MRTNIITLLLIALVVGGFTSTGVSAQSKKVKIVDKSSRKQPNWVNSSEKDYIITSAFGDDLESAKNNCLDNVRKYIISAVAENVKLSSSSTVSQRVESNTISSFEDYFSSEFATKSAEVPFLKGVSASKIEDYYWEVQQEKGGTKTTRYLYAIKYPFPSLELKKMVRDFELRDTEMYDSYINLKNNLNKVESVEQIDQAIVELNSLVNYFFDDVRKNDARDLQASYKSLYDNITFKPISDKLGEYRFGLMIGDRPIKTSQRIKFQSKDTDNINVGIEGNEIVVKYDYENSEYDVDNTIRTTFRFGGKPAFHDIHYKVSRHGLAVWPQGNIYLKAEEVSDTALVNIAIRMELKSKIGKKYKVNSLILEVPNFSTPIIIDGVDAELEKSEDVLNVTYPETVGLVATKHNRMNYPMIKGSMEVVVPSTKQTKMVRFTLPYSCNW